MNKEETEFANSLNEHDRKCYKNVMDKIKNMTSDQWKELASNNTFSPTPETASEGEKGNSQEKLDSWISVEDRLPEVDVKSSDVVEVYGEYDHCTALYSKHGNKGQWLKIGFLGDAVLSNITHWKKLSAPPTQDKIISPKRETTNSEVDCE